jgi:hypothetical protein
MVMRLGAGSLDFGDYIEGGSSPCCRSYSPLPAWRIFSCKWYCSYRHNNTLCSKHIDHYCNRYCMYRLHTTLLLLLLAKGRLDISYCSPYIIGWPYSLHCVDEPLVNQISSIRFQAIRVEILTRKSELTKVSCQLAFSP